MSSKYDRERIFILNDPIAPRLCPTLAVEIGLNESILFLQFEFWIVTSGHLEDEKLWTWQSLRDLRKAFPFWSIATINRTIHNLEQLNLIEIGNYNRAKYDRTRWFTINFDEAKKLSSITVAQRAGSETHSAQNETGSTQNDTHSAQNDTTIPEITSDISPEITSEKKDCAVAQTPATDPETTAWIADLEATVPPVSNPPHSADEFKAQLLVTERRMWDRIRAEPWLAWGKDCTALDTYDGKGQSMRRLGYELENRFGLKPAWSSKRAIKAWLMGLADCLDAGGGDMTPVLDAATKLLHDGLTVSGPTSLVKTTRALVAQKTIHLSGTPKVLRVG